MTSCDPPADILARAREIAASVLFPATLAVDAAEVVPAGHLNLLADEGFYGIAAPPEFGGPELDFTAACAIMETFASACLCTTFVWMQHHGAVLRLAYGQAPKLREDRLPRLITGERRAGVVLGGTLPGEPQLVARPTAGGYVLTGQSPWVTGWNMVDVLAVAARDGDTLVWAATGRRGIGDVGGGTTPDGRGIREQYGDRQVHRASGARGPADRHAGLFSLGAGRRRGAENERLAGPRPGQQVHTADDRRPTSAVRARGGKSTSRIRSIASRNSS